MAKASASACLLVLLAGGGARAAEGVRASSPAAPGSQNVADPAPRPRSLTIRVHGTVLYSDTFRLKSPIDGRVEVLSASTGAWAGPEAPSVLVASPELAALLDADATTPRDILDDRWRRIYRPAEARCPFDCYILHVYAKPGKWVKANALLLEGARSLKLLGRVKPDDCHWVKDGMTVTVWPKASPKRRLSLPVQNFILDVQGTNQGPWGSFMTRLSRGRYLEPGTEWEGVIEIRDVDIPSEPGAAVRTELRTASRSEGTSIAGRKNPLWVPTRALIKFRDALYLPVRVSTGASTTDMTEITAGLAEKQQYLVMNLSDLDCSTATARGGPPASSGRTAPGARPGRPPRPARSQDRIEVLDPPPPDPEEE